jgi:hypothetical protein
MQKLCYFNVLVHCPTPPSTKEKISGANSNIDFKIEMVTELRTKGQASRKLWMVSVLPYTH